MARRRLVEGTGYDFAVDRALHVRNLFGALVNQKHDECYFRVILRNGVGNCLQEHGLARARRCDDQPSLAFADGRHQINNARRKVLFRRLHLQLLVRVERR